MTDFEKGLQQDLRGSEFVDAKTAASLRNARQSALKPRAHKYSPAWTMAAASLCFCAVFLTYYQQNDHERLQQEPIVATQTPSALWLEIEETEEISHNVEFYELMADDLLASNL